MAEQQTALRVKIALQSEQFQKGLKKVQGDTNSFAAGMRRATGNINRVFVRGFQAATLALAGFGAASAKVGMDFENSMAFVGATANATTADMVRLQTEAREIGKATLFTASQAAKGMTEFARASMTADEMIAVTRPTMMLAGATMTEMSLAAQGVVTTLKQFGLGVGEAERVTDVLSMATRKSLFTLNGLLTSLKYAGPQARAYGMSLEETVAALMMFRDTGLQAHQAGVYFRMMLSKTATVIPKAEKELSKYGLTARQVSLDTNNFGGVLKNLKKAVDDGIKLERVFGIRAGPIVANLVKNLDAGKDSIGEWAEKTNQLNYAVGTNEEMYMRVMDTVQNQFTIAKSAFEELLLVIFNTYAKELKEFATEFGNTIRFVAENLTGAASTGEGFAATLENATKFMRDNQVAIARSVEGLIESLQTLVGIISWMITNWKMLATIIGTVFIASKVFAFSQAIVSLISGLTSLGITLVGVKAGIMGVMGSLSALLPPIAAIAAAIGALTIAFHVFGEESDRTDEVFEKLSKQRNQQRDDLAKEAEEVQNNTREYVHGLRERLKQEGKLTDVVDGHLRALQGMSAEAAAAKEAQGQLFRTQIQIGNKTQEIFISNAAALNLYNEKIDEGVVFEKEARDSVSDLIDTKKEYEDKIKDINKDLEEYNKQVALAPMGARALQASFDAKLMKDYGFTVAEAGGHLKDLEFRLRQASAAANKSRTDFDKHQKSIQGRETTKAIQDLEKRQKESEKQRKKLIRDREKAAEKTLEIEKRLTQDLTALRLGDMHTQRLEFEKKLEKIKEAFDKESELYKRSKRKQLEIERRFQASKAMLLEIAELESINKIRDLATKAVEQKNDALLNTEEERIAAQKKKELAAIDKTLEQSRILHSANLDAIKLLEMEALIAKMQVNKKFETLENQKKIERAKTIQTQIESEILAIKLGYLNDWERIQIEGDLRVAELRKINATDEQIALAQKLTLENKRQYAVQNSEALQFAVKGNADLARLNNKAIAAKSSFRKKSLQSELAKEIALNEIGEKRKQANSLRAAGKLTEEEFRLERKHLDALEKAAIQSDKQTQKEIRKNRRKQLAALLKMAVDHAKKIGKVFSSAFSMFTGDFGFDLKGQIQELAELTREMKEQGARVDFGAEAKSRVGDAFTGATTFMQTAIKALPSLLNEFSKRIPFLAMSFAKNVPVIVASFAQNIGPLVSALLGAIPVVVETLMRQLPAIVSLAGQFISQIIAMMPEIVMSLVAETPRIIAALIDSLGVILDALIEALPVIVEAVIAAIPSLLKAVAEALPVLLPKVIMLFLKAITVVLEAIPLIVEAIMASVPDIITALIESIPRILAGLVMMLPSLISSIIKLLPMLVVGIIKALPDIIVALVEGLFKELVFKTPQLVILILKSIVVALVDAIVSIGQAIGDVFRSKKGKAKAKERRAINEADREAAMREEAERALGSGSLESFYSGISYVPANMRVQVHKGEAIVPADRNPAAGGSSQARAGADGLGTAPQSIDIAIMAEGRLLDAVQVTAMDRGNAPGITDRLTRASGITVGLDRGRFDYWGR